MAVTDRVKVGLRGEFCPRLLWQGVGDGGGNIRSWSQPSLLEQRPGSFPGQPAEPAAVSSLCLYTVFFGTFVKNKKPYVAALIASTVIATLSLAKHFNLLSEGTLSTLNHIPFFKYELGWVVPSFVLFVLMVLISGTGKSKE